MAYYRRRQNKYVEKEIEREESEEIEEIQNNGYDSNDLYPTNINFIIPSKQRALRKINKAKYNQRFNKKKIKSREFPKPICTCKLPNSNYQNFYNINNEQYRIPTCTDICPYCIKENELIVNENPSFRTEINDFPFNEIDDKYNEYINSNRSMRNIRGNIENQKYMVNSHQRLNRREIPYNNEIVYFIPYSKNQNSNRKINKEIDSNIIKKNNNFNFDDDNIFLKDKGIVKIIRDDKEIINLDEIDNDDKGEMKYNNMFIVEQKTNNFIIDNEDFPLEINSLKEKNKNMMKENNNIIEKNVSNEQKCYVDENKQIINDDINNKKEENKLTNLNINNLNEDKEKNYNLTEENENVDNEKNININQENNEIKNVPSEEKINEEEEEKQKNLIDFNKEENNVEKENLIENEKNISNLDENYNDLNNNLNEEKEENLDINENENLNIKENEENLNMNENENLNIKENEENLDMNEKENLDIKEKENLDIKEKENFDQKENNEKQIDDINLKIDIYKNEIDNKIMENEPKEEVQNKEFNIEEKINNLEDNKPEENIENDINLNLEQNIQEDEQKQNEKEEISIKQNEHNQLNNYNIETVDENAEYEQSIKNDENKEDEHTSQINKKKEENFDINKNKNEEIINNYVSTNNPKIESNYSDIKNKKETNTNKSIKQNLQNEFDVNLNINKEINQRNDNSTNKKNSSNSLNNKLNLENKNFNYKVPQSSELLFNPKIRKKKKIEPLFSRYEQLEGQQQYSNSTFHAKEPLYKNTIEIFPSFFGNEMSFTNESKQSDNMIHKSISTTNNTANKKVLKKYQNKTTSDKKRNLLKQMNQNDISKDRINIRTDIKNYQTYINNSKSNNPFVGLSHYDKNFKERKKLITKKIQKEENVLNDILIIEKNILKKRKLSEKEFNLFIIKLSKYIFEKNEQDLDNSINYDFKINKISNILKTMKKEEQNKVLENLKKQAKNEHSNNILKKIKQKLDEFKDKIIKAYKTEKGKKTSD